MPTIELLVGPLTHKLDVLSGTPLQSPTRPLGGPALARTASRRVPELSNGLPEQSSAIV
jgi:hypothetical protein